MFERALPHPTVPVIAGDFGPAPSRSHGPDDVHLKDILKTFYRRRWVVVAVVSAAIGVALAYNHEATPIYEARARLLIEPSFSQVVTFRPVVEEEQGTLDYYQTQYEVLRSRTLAGEALQKLAPSMSMQGITEAERAARISDFLHALSISPITGSRVVDVKFRSSDPEMAARAANAVAQAYIDSKVEVRLRAGREASAWLTDRLAELRKQVDAREGALQQYREEKDAVSLEDRQNIVVQKFAQLTSAATTARTERIAKQTLYEQLRSVQERNAPLDTFPPILSNAFIQSLKAELATLQRERAQLSQQLGDLHPDMIKVNNAIAVAERRLDAELQKVVSGIENDFKTAQATERGLLTALEQQKDEVSELNRKSIGYGALKRDATSTQQIFESVLQRVKEADLTGELQTNNARILDAAEVPGMPFWPKVWLNLVLAVFAGLTLSAGLVLGLEYMFPRIETPEDVGQALGLPLLGTTPIVLQLKDGFAAIDVDASFEEALRGIRATILLSPTNGAVRTLAVTSTNVGEGKTVVAGSLAVSMARSGRRVLVVDADMRRPRVHHSFNVPRSPGLADVIAGNTLASDALCQSSVEGLWILPPGALKADSADLLDIDRLGGLVRGFSEVFDLIIIDSPPVMAVADAAIIANAASSVVFVVAVGATSPEAARTAVGRLVAAQARVIGVVLNRAPRGTGYSPYYVSEPGEPGNAHETNDTSAFGSLRG